ncbi:hypothetical protein J6590_003931 [Homalodisca vitripennis]|nr:hypothetical protein J6590_003931 [Homalodisca vitripennis]
MDQIHSSAQDSLENALGMCLPCLFSKTGLNDGTLNNILGILQPNKGSITMVQLSRNLLSTGYQTSSTFPVELRSADECLLVSSHFYKWSFVVYRLSPVFGVNRSQNRPVAIEDEKDMTEDRYLLFMIKNNSSGVSSTPGNSEPGVLSASISICKLTF